MPCVPGGRSCSFISSTTPAPFAPLLLSDSVIVPTLLPWASFISTTVLAALVAAQKTMVDDTAAMNSCWCFMAPNYSGLYASCDDLGCHHRGTEPQRKS